MRWTLGSDIFLICGHHPHDTHFYKHAVRRITSDLFPWNSKYELKQLPDYPAIQEMLAQTGQVARQLGQRITAHPNHFVRAPRALCVACVWIFLHVLTWFLHERAHLPLEDQCTVPTFCLHIRSAHQPLLSGQ